MASYTATVSDRIKINGAPGTAQGHVETVSASIVVGQQAGYSSRLVLQVSGKMRLRSVIVTTGLFHYMLRSTIKTRDSSRHGISVIVAALMKLTPRVKSTTLTHVIEAIELSARLGLRSLARQRVGDLVRMRSVSTAGWRRLLSEHMHFAPSAYDQLFAQIKAAEELTLAAAVSKHLVCNIICDETVDLDDALHVKALFKDHLFEQISFGLKLHQPDGTTTTWMVNTRSGAVTEYMDYAYRSFAKLPNGTYLGAAEDGNLYELQGDADDGMPIVADVVGGILDMGGSRFTQLKAVYLAVRASGKFLLKLTTDNDVTRTYEVRVLPNRTARIDIGKGLRSRYIQWELISTGQDFDVQSLEFVPLISRRRV